MTNNLVIPKEEEDKVVEEEEASEVDSRTEEEMAEEAIEVGKQIKSKNRQPSNSKPQNP